MTDNPTAVDRRPALVAAYAHAANVVIGVRPDQLGGPTPCPDYDVASLVDHLVGAGWRAVELGRGETPTGAEFPHVELADAPGQLRKAGAEAAAAWSDDRLAATTTMPWGETYTGATLVDMYLSEFVAHAWDLAVATSQTPSCDQYLAAAALSGAQAMLRPEYRDMMGVGNPFGAEQVAPDGAAPPRAFRRFHGTAPRLAALRHSTRRARQSGIHETAFPLTDRPQDIDGEAFDRVSTCSRAGACRGCVRPKCG